jgi:hypothetical protein
MSAEGVSLRDYFAAKAMQAVIASSDDFDTSFDRKAGRRRIARKSYRIADAMLAEREIVGLESVSPSEIVERSVE